MCSAVAEVNPIKTLWHDGLGISLYAIPEMNVESYRRRAALENSKRKRGRIARIATEKNTASD